eukprot:6412369-Amphidinium_carterae.1
MATPLAQAPRCMSIVLSSSVLESQSVAHCKYLVVCVHRTASLIEFRLSFGLDGISFEEGMYFVVAILQSWKFETKSKYCKYNYCPRHCACATRSTFMCSLQTQAHKSELDQLLKST